MRLSCCLAISAVLFVADVCAQGGDGGRRGGRGRAREAAPVELQNFEFKEVDFDAKSLAEGKGRVGLYLPKGWQEHVDARYPLVIWLHGFGGYGEFQSQGAAATLDKLRGAGDIPEMVVAAFVAPGRGRRARSTYLNGEAAGDVEDAICKDLVAYVSDNFPVAKDRGHRAIMGISIGGFGALKIGMKHKDVFGAIAAHSSAVFPDDPEQLPEQYKQQLGFMMQRGGLDQVFGDPIDKVKWAAEMPMGIVRKADKDTFAGTAIYFDAGTEDRYGFAELNSALSKLMQEKGVAHTFRLVEGGGHAWSSDSMLPNLEQSLKFVGGAMRGEPAAAPAGDGEAADKGK